MATRKVPAEQMADDEIQQAMSVLQEDSFNGDAISPALDSLYAELGVGEQGDAMVHVTMLNVDGTGKEAIIWRGKPEDYDLEYLAKQFGSGEYRVKVYVANVDGRKVIRGNKVFTWKLTPDDERRRLNPEPVAPAFNPLDLARMITDGIRAAMPAPSTQPDPMEQMVKMAQLMQMMRPPEPQYQQAQPANQLGMMRDMAELIQTLKGDSDEPAARGANSNDLLMTVISKFAPLLTGVLAQQAGNPMAIPSATHAPQLQSQPVSPYPPIPQPEPILPDLTAPQAQSNEGNEVSLKLRMGLAWMIGQCDGGGAPETYAEVVLDSVPVEAVTQLLSSPDPLGYLAQFEPRVNTEPYKTWFTNLIGAIKEFTKPEEGGNHVQPA